MNPDEMDGDDNFEVDFAGMEKRAGGDFRIPKGQHPARVSDVVKKISNAGNPQLEWTYALTDLPGKTIKRWTALSEQAKWVLHRDLVAMGLCSDDEGSKVTFSRREAIGRHVILDIQDDNFNGKATSKVARVNPHPEGAVQKSDEPPPF